jgi:hypothetical protein
MRPKEKRWHEKHPDRIPQKAWERRNPAHFLFIHASYGAARRGLDCTTITLELVEEMLRPMRCSVTGHTLSFNWSGPGSNPWRPSIDRIDSTKGYVPGNVRIVSWVYNLAKSKWSDEAVAQFRGAGPNA